MLRESWFIAVQDIRHMLRSRETLLWLFVMPVLFIYFIGTITSGFGQGPRPARDTLVVQASGDAGFLADRVIKYLEENNYRVVRDTGGGEKASRRLVIPSGFTVSVLRGEKATIRFSNDESGPGQDYHTLRVGRAVYTTLADVAAVSESGAEPGPEEFQRLDEMPRNITLEVRAAGKRQRIPTGFEQAVPGIMVMFTLLALLTTGAVMLVIERREGLLRRLASTPISAQSVVLGKWTSRLALGLIQIAFAMAAGTALFRMNWGPDLPMIVLVLLGWGALCASLGLLLGNLVRTEGQAIAIGVLAANLLAAFGGCWWPIEITPRWMQAFAAALPTGWAMDAMHRLISFQAGAAGASIHLAAMLASALVLGWLAARKFRFS